MQFLKKVLVVSAAALMLSACSNYINHDDVKMLHKGMSPRAVAQVVSSSPEETLDMRVHHQHVTVQVYGSGNKTYLLVYKHHHLVHWGSLSHFVNSRNHFMRMVGRRTQADMGVTHY